MVATQHPWLARALVWTLALGASSASAQKMYWTDSASHKVQRANLDGSDVEDLIRNLVTRPTEVVLDPGGGPMGRMYWADEDTDRIQRANLDGSQVEDLVTSPGSPPSGLALDPDGGWIYWTITTQEQGRLIGSIQRARLDGSGVVSLVSQQIGINSLSPLTLDLAGGKIYWSDGHDQIRRANLDGSGVQDLVVLTSGFSPSAVELDPQAGRIYWTQGFLSTARVRRARLDGSEVQDLVAGQGGIMSRVSLDLATGKMYWMEGALIVGASTVRRANLDGSQPEDIATADTRPVPVSIDPRTGQLYWTTGSRIQRTLVGSGVVQDLVTLELRSAQGLALELASGLMYWTDPSAGRVQRAQLDGTQVQDLVSRTLLRPQAIALDRRAGQMYWTEASRVRRANLDGSAIEDLVTGLRSAHGVAVDPFADRIYWTDTAGDTVELAGLDGSDPALVLSLPSPMEIAVHPTGRKLYWVFGFPTIEDQFVGGILRAELDGTQAELVVGAPSDALGGLALDRVAGKVYWTDSRARPPNTSLRRPEIQRANLDGSEIEDLVTTGLDGPAGISLHVTAGQMYWTDTRGGSIHRANLDGSAPEVLITGLESPQAIALDVPSTPFSVRLQPSYLAGELRLDLELGSTAPTTWALSLLGLNSGVLGALSVPLPPLDPPLGIPLPIPGFPPLGNLGVLSTLATPAEGIVASDWRTVDTAAPTLASCTLVLGPSLQRGDLRLSFALASSEPATWRTWLSVQGALAELWSVPLPAIDPPLSIPISIPGFPSLRTVGFLTTLSTAAEGVVCSDWTTIDTGAAPAGP